MRTIDVHHHWVNEPAYLYELEKEMDRLEIERTGLMALGPLFEKLFLTQEGPVGCCDNEQLAEVLRERGDRFFGYGFHRLGKDEPELVDWFAEKGFAGVKFHIPVWNYDDERAFPVYERAAQNGLVCLFHTGIFSMPEPVPGERLSSARCRPIMLDPIAHEFPELRIVLAHLGVCWGEEAATLCRVHSNIYADLSGKVDGWISSKDMSWFREKLFWPGSWRKILFGSDVHYSQLEETLRRQVMVGLQLGWSSNEIDGMFYRNAKTLFGF